MEDRSFYSLRQDDISFSSQQKVLPILAQQMSDWKGRSVLMAGHYMLTYRRTSDCLVPLMTSVTQLDPQTSDLERQYVKDVGDFPERSFELGLGLLASKLDADRKIALVVNDDQFRQFQDLGRDVDLVQLRREYYWNQPIPAGFSEALKRFPQITDVFLKNNARNREKHDSCLPPNTIYFSEKALRNRFLKDGKKELLGKPGFRESKVWGEQKLIYETPNSAHALCLVDDVAGCGCSGAMFEFLMILHKKHQVENLVLIIPLECVAPVRETIKAFMQSQGLFNQIIGVWGDRVTADGLVNFSKATVYQYSSRT